MYLAAKEELISSEHWDAIQALEEQNKNLPPEKQSHYNSTILYELNTLAITGSSLHKHFSNLYPTLIPKPY